MRGKGWIDMFRLKHIAGASKVRHVGRCFAREERIIAQACLLAPFDFAIPIRPFDKANAHPPPGIA